MSPDTPTKQRGIDIKLEPIDSFFASSSSSPSSHHENSESNAPIQTKNDVNNSEDTVPIKKPERRTAFPSKTSRSIVWDHISWKEDTQRAGCNYCPADFQIKGGTSAVLRHLKSTHPTMIDFDPETAPPIRRKKRKTEEVVPVQDDTRSYVDNLLKQFITDSNDFSTSEDTTGDSNAQARADSEIDEVIRSLKERENEPKTESGSDQDIKKILGILDEPAVVEDIGVGADLQKPENFGGIGISSNAEQDGFIPRPLIDISSFMAPFATNQVSKKRRTEENEHESPHSTIINNDKMKHGKFPANFAQSMKRPNGNSFPPFSTNIPPSFIPHSHIDYESKILYQKSLKVTMERDEAMTEYYNAKARLIELEIKKLSKEMES